MKFFSPDEGGATGAATEGVPGVDPPSMLGSAPSDTPSAPSSAPNGEFVTGDGHFRDGWTQRLPDDLGDARAGFQKFKSVSDLAKSYHNLERTIGQRGVIVPTEKSTPDDIAAFRKAMGVPEKPEGYQIRPDALPEGVTWNDDLAKPYLEIAHKHHLPPKAVRELVAANLKQKELEVLGVQQMIKQRMTEGEDALKTSWGTNYGTNLKRVKLAAELAGIPRTTFGLGDPQVVLGLHRLAGMISEDKLIAAGGAVQIGEGKKARAKDIQTNEANPLNAKYLAGDQDTINLVRDLNKD